MPHSAERQLRVTPIAITIVRASTTSTNEAVNVAVSSAQVELDPTSGIVIDEALRDQPPLIAEITSTRERASIGEASVARSRST